MRIELLERIYRHYSAQNDGSQCIEILGECLTIDPYNERYALLMLKALVAQGKNIQAVSFYKSFTGSLRRHLNLPPPEELTALIDAIHPAADQHDPPVRPRPQANVTVSTYCLPGADFFWMGDMLAQLARLFPLDSLPIAPAYRADLALIFPAIAAAPGVPVPEGLLPARLVSAFYALLQALPAAALTLEVEAGVAPVPSLEALRCLLARRPLPGVELRIL
jgi:hypothetical protein